MNTVEGDTRQLSVADLSRVVKDWWSYLVSKWIIILTVAFLFGCIGVLYAWYKKPVYTAELTFAPETSGGSTSMLGAYAGLASQFGLDVGGGGGVFEGENLTELLRSRLLIRRALLSPMDKTVGQNLLIDYYVRVNELNKDWSEKPELAKISFQADMQPGIRARDSVLNSVITEIYEDLEIQKIDKRVNIVAARVKGGDELFCKMFIEQLVTNGIKYYVDYRSKKTRDNVQILQRQTDSVRSILTGNIISVAQSTDLNVNPIRQIVRTNVQRKQIDVQANSALYAELVKNLELSKITLRKETPLVQIIDVPVLPLKKEKPGKLLTGILFAFLGGFLVVSYLFFKRLLKGS